MIILKMKNSCVMKKLYTLLLFAIATLLFTDVQSQITIADAIAIDGDSDGNYGTLEIQFSEGIDYSDFQTSVANGDWTFSLNSDFSNNVVRSGISTTVSYIASASGTDDEYVQLQFSSPQFVGCQGPIYIRYINSGTNITDDESCRRIL